jgi:hypothetical protein
MKKLAMKEHKEHKEPIFVVILCALLWQSLKFLS